MKHAPHTQGDPQMDPTDLANLTSSELGELANKAVDRVRRWLRLSTAKSAGRAMSVGRAKSSPPRHASTRVLACRGGEDFARPTDIARPADFAVDKRNQRRTRSTALFASSPNSLLVRLARSVGSIWGSPCVCGACFTVHPNWETHPAEHSQRAVSAGVAPSSPTSDFASKSKRPVTRLFVFENRLLERSLFVR